MLPQELTDTLSAHPSLVPVGQVLVLGSLLLFGGLLYVAVRMLRSVYRQQAMRFSRCRKTGHEATRQLLEHIGLPADRIDSGAKIDHFDVWRNRVRLRTESSVSSSVAALAIAAHEVGHAEQFAKGYWAAHATRALIVLLLVGGALVFVYPFVATIIGTGDVNLASLIGLSFIVLLLRLPVSLALELDATKRAKRMLKETSLAAASEDDGISQLLRAGFVTHLAMNVGLILLISACVATMWVIESGLDAGPVAQVSVVNPNEFGASPWQPGPILVDDQLSGQLYPIVAIASSIVLVWWAFSNKPRTTGVRSAIDANNEGMARFQAGDLVSAVALIDEALEKNPKLTSAHYNRAVVLTTLGRTPAALASMDALFASPTEDLAPFLSISDPWFLRGTLRLDSADYRGAIDDFTRALSLDPQDEVLLLRNRGLAWIKFGDLDRALQDTDDALLIAPDDAVAYNNRGVIYRDLGDYDRAEADLRQAIEIDPELPNPREHLANLLDQRQSAAALQAVG